MAELYLSQLMPRPLRRDVQRDLVNCHNMHRRMLLAFPDDSQVERARERYGVLYRVERRRDALVALVQSRMEPDWGRLPEGYLASVPEVKRVDLLYERLETGMDLRFRLRANPTRRISDRNMSQGERWRGKRVNLRREEDQVAWLRRKGEQGGFALVVVRALPEVSDVRAAPEAAVHGTRRGTGRLTFGAVVLDGRLRVTDVARLREALADGIGSGKAFGFGLLSVAPITRLGG